MGNHESRVMDQSSSSSSSSSYFGRVVWCNGENKTILDYDYLEERFLFFIRFTIFSFLLLFEAVTSRRGGGWLCGE